MIKTQMEMYLHEELETLTRTEIEALQFAPYGPSLYEISFLSETVCRGSFVS